MYSPRQYKYRDSYVYCIYLQYAVRTFGSVNFTHTLLVQTHTHDVSALDWRASRVSNLFIQPCSWVSCGYSRILQVNNEVVSVDIEIKHRKVLTSDNIYSMFLLLFCL